MAVQGTLGQCRVLQGTLGCLSQGGIGTLQPGRTVRLARRHVATQLVATQLVATQNVATQHVATQHIATQHVAAQHVAAQHVATQRQMSHFFRFQQQGCNVDEMHGPKRGRAGESSMDA